MASILCTNRNKNQLPAVARVGRSYRLDTKTSVRLPVTKRKRFSKVTAVPYTALHAFVTLLYQTLQLKLGYDTIIRRTWLMAADRNFAFKIAVKPLQIKTAYRNSLSLYLTVLLPIPYDVPFSHNTCVTHD